MIAFLFFVLSIVAILAAGVTLYSLTKLIRTKFPDENSL
jgi:hypothetical protein